MDSLLRKEKLSFIIDILLRVPPFFVMDMICSSKHCFTIDGIRTIKVCITFFMRMISNMKAGSFMMHFQIPSFEDILYFVLHLFGFFIALVLFTQKTQYLLSFYLSVAAVGVIIWSYILNEEYVKYCYDLHVQQSSIQNEMFFLNKKALQAFFCNYVLQTVLAVVFCFSTMNLPQFPPKKFLVGVLFILPTIINAALPSSVLTFTPFFVAVSTSFVLACYFMSFFSRIFNLIYFYGSSSFLIPTYEMFQMISLIWGGYHFAHLLRGYHLKYVLRVYGSIRLLKDLIFLVYDDIFIEYFENGNINFSEQQAWYILQELLIKSCDNIIAICGVTSILTFCIDHFIYKPIENFLIVPSEEEKNISAVLSFLLIILTLQLGITTLKPEQRLLSIITISMMMSSIILYQISLLVCNMLNNLSVKGNLSYNKHCRVLIMAVIIITICSLWVAYLLSNYSYNPWLVPVTLCNIEIVISTVISLIIYALNMIHLHSQKVWYELYDYIFYLESTNNLISLILNIILFIKGVYAFLFEFSSLLKLFLLVVHLYYNIWVEFARGCKVIQQRKLIVDCINSLLVATEEEIEEVGGLCAICYEDIGHHVTSITRCNHFFHSYCLKKWLNERKTCPICHRIILHDLDSERAVRVRNAFHIHQA